MFEKLKEHSGSEVSRMLTRFEKRVLNNKVDKTKMESAAETVDAALTKAKEFIDKKDFNTFTVENLKEITNAWVAGKEDGVFKDSPEIRANLEKIAGKEPAHITDKALRYARQIWRTEMVSYIIRKLKDSTRTDKAAVLENIMASQIVTKFEDEPHEALRAAMHLDRALLSRGHRTQLAEKMKSSTVSGKIIEIPLLFKDFDVKELKVLTGGEMLSVPVDLAGDLKFKHMVFEDGRIYGQMENGCKGNLVIIEGVFPGPSGKFPEGPSGKLPEGPSGKLPEGPSGKLPEGPSGKLPEGPSGKLPEGPSGKLPEGPSGKLPEGLSGKLPEGPSGKLPEGPSGKLPEGLSGKLPEGPSGKLPEGPSGKAPEGPSGKLPEGPSGKAPEGPSGKLPEGPSGKLPEGPSGKLPEGPSGKLPEGPSGKLPEGPSGALPKGPTGELPEAITGKLPKPRRKKRKKIPQPKPIPGSERRRGESAPF